MECCPSNNGLIGQIGLSPYCGKCNDEAAFSQAVILTLHRCFAARQMVPRNERVSAFQKEQSRQGANRPEQSTKA